MEGMEQWRSHGSEGVMEDLPVSTLLRLKFPTCISRNSRVIHISGWSQEDTFSILHGTKAGAK